jgi:hypothetical protein
VRHGGDHRSDEMKKGLPKIKGALLGCSFSLLFFFFARRPDLEAARSGQLCTSSLLGD